MTGPARLCPQCGTAEPVPPGERIWPLGWRCGTCGFAVPDRDGLPMFAPALADTISGMDPKQFAGLAAIEDRHFWFRARRKLINGLLRMHFPAARSVLEIGCGNGTMLSAIATERRWDRIAGSELHPAGLAFARPRVGPEVELVQMDARHIPARAAFDVIGAFDVIEHIAEDEAVLAEMHAALTPGGGTIITVPQHKWMWSAADEIAYHQRRYTRRELREKLARAGFEIVLATSYTAVLLPLMAASRILARRAPRQRDAVNREFAVSRPINATLSAILGAEVALTLMGLPWPAGGSLVMVARRR